MYFEKVLKGTALTKSSNAVLACKELVKDKSGDQWGIDKPGDVALDYFWAFGKNNVLEEDGDTINSVDGWIELDIALCFMLGRPTWNIYCNIFDEHIYYVINEIKKPFNIIIIYYAECVRGVFQVEKLIPLPIMKNEEYHEPNWNNREINYKEDIIWGEIKEKIPTVMQ